MNQDLEDKNLVQESEKA